MLTHLILCLDGISPDYLVHASVPTIDALGRQGWRTVGQSAMPAVTNVNNVSIITGGPPALHGITANYYRNRTTGQAIYMEAADFVLAPTIFEEATRAGRRSAVITAKDKLRTVLERGATEVVSAESPPAWLVERIGPPPPILSVEVNHWLFQAAGALCQVRPPDVLYLSTTDYAQHMHAPESDESKANLAALDRLLEMLLNSGPEFAVVLTADHGMVAKTHGLDLGRILAAAGIAADAVPIIKDRYVAHHQNLGGAAYIFMENPSQLEEATSLLREERGVESVWTRDAAAEKFQLYRDRIGDLFVLATEETVFGDLPSPREPVSVRSHGGLHTRAVPIIAYGPGVPAEPFSCNYQAAAWICW
ncbi:MAG TPA: alkaline phosphatase family protein [Anaerolineae bacterium]|nr:alkaline phosphatase family protein [Anaerolineae bacterium]